MTLKHALVEYHGHWECRNCTLEWVCKRDAEWARANKPCAGDAPITVTAREYLALLAQERDLQEAARDAYRL